MSVADPESTALQAKEPGKRERKKAEKQRRIVDAAVELFREHGFEGTTTADIARRAGIGAGTLYLYVGSKEDLLVAVFREDAGHAWDAAFDAVDRSRPVVEQIVTVFARVTDHHEADQRLARAYFKELSYVGEEAREGVREFMRGFYGQLSDLLRDAQQVGQLDPDVPARTVAGNLFAIWHLLMQRHSNGSLPYDKMMEQLALGLEVALWGMTPRP